MPAQWTIAVPETSNPVTLDCDCYVHQFGAIAPRRREPYYETDMSDAEWALVRASMPMPAWMESRGGRPEAHCHRDVIDAVRYVVDNGAKWCAVPRDFRWWRAVYDFFRRWRAHGYVRELYRGQEPLGCAGTAEAFHIAFALPGGLVAVLGPVVSGTSTGGAPPRA